jgi:NAD(P)-dependent dehydrogenase (short-subunit alcohol dehydrogenase family)
MTGVRDRVVVVTGAGRGLGRAYALYLAGEGARVVVNDLGAGLHGEQEGGSVADEVVAEIVGAGGQAVASTASVVDPTGARAIVETALDSFGRVDAVVNNAGILRDVSFAKMEQAQWEGVLQTHLFGTYNVTRAAWRHFRDQEYGRIIGITSSTGLFGNFGQANYGAAKQGIVGLVYTLALEGAKYGIKANALSPMGATRMTATAVAKADPKIAERLDPIRVAPAVAYLCSDECEESGVVIRAGGGHYSRVAYMQSPGVDFDEVPALAEFAKSWSQILDMTDAKLGGAVGQF